MAVISRRVVISKGNVARRADFHLPASGQLNDEKAKFLPNLNAPLQRLWWVPLSNLAGLAHFNVIQVKRALIDAADPTFDWNDLSITVRSAREGAAKIAIQVYAAVADIRRHNANDVLNEVDVGKLHTNATATTAVTLTLPDAAAESRGAELFFQVKVGQTFTVMADAGGTADQIEVAGVDQSSVTASAVGEKMAISWLGRNRWRVTDKTAGWT
ncbi:MAG: hypothetical protein HY000_32035 [Planctomycetes bacterium]|nr:hypothetical protein [Planctomycetota bacterium]